uniref:Uncharacterized protein n=1 Tax=Salix viminalis TaxID=40686 RepID=A0A6N2NFK0_SALVM
MEVFNGKTAERNGNSCCQSLSFEALFENALLMDRLGEGEAVIRRLQEALDIAEEENKFTDRNEEAKEQFAKYRELSPKKFEVEGYLRPRYRG